MKELKLLEFVIKLQQVLSQGHSRLALLSSYATPDDKPKVPGPLVASVYEAFVVNHGLEIDECERLS